MYMTRRPFITKLLTNGPDVQTTALSPAIVAVETNRP